MSNQTKTTSTAIAIFIDGHINALSGRKSLKAIARSAGLSSNMLSMIRYGRTKLPVKHAFALAAALECDRRKLVLLALEDDLGPDTCQDLLRLMTTGTEHLSNHL